MYLNKSKPCFSRVSIIIGEPKSRQLNFDQLTPLDAAQNKINVKKMKKRWILPLFVLCQLLGTIGYTQESQKLFEDGDRITFLGNSITQDGRYISYLRRFYGTRFPEQKLKFINCGISGDVSDGMLKRLDTDVLVHQPDYSFIMVGMNDVKRGLYEGKKTDSTTESEKKVALENYFRKTDSLVLRFSENNVQPILLTPTIYEQNAILDRPNNYGVNDALFTCAEHLRNVAQKKELPLVDLHFKMDSINTIIQKKDSTFTLVGPDRVHPGDTGHFIMAYQILDVLKNTSVVSDVFIDMALKKVVVEKNAQVESLTFKKKKISFNILEASLPFAIQEKEQEALAYVPFIEKFNQQRLAVTNLKKGSYHLLIDKNLVGNYSSKSIGGWNQPCHQ